LNRTVAYFKTLVVVKSQYVYRNGGCFGRDSNSIHPGNKLVSLPLNWLLYLTVNFILTVLN